MELAQNIAGRDMDAMALQYLDIEEPKIRNLSDVNRNDKEKFNYEILRLWKQKTGNTKEVKIKEQIFNYSFILKIHSEVSHKCNH